MSQKDYAAQYDGYVARYEAAKERALTLERRRAERKAKRDAIKELIRALERQETVFEFDEDVWREAVSKVTVKNDGMLEFFFKNDMSITV